MKKVLIGLVTFILILATIILVFKFFAVFVKLIVSSLFLSIKITGMIFLVALVALIVILIILFIKKKKG